MIENTQYIPKVLSHIHPISLCFVTILAIKGYYCYICNKQNLLKNYEASQ